MDTLVNNHGEFDISINTYEQLMEIDALDYTFLE